MTNTAVLMRIMEMYMHFAEVLQQYLLAPERSCICCSEVSSSCFEPNPRINTAVDRQAYARVSAGSQGG